MAFSGSYIQSAWPSVYNQKAKCVRILCQNLGESSSEIPDIERIKFITNEIDSHTKDGFRWSALVKHLSSLDEFYETLNLNLNGFDNSTIDSEYWTEICSLLELANFKYRENPEPNVGWLADLQTKEEDFSRKASSLSLVQQKFVGKFGAALQSDMKETEATSWMSSLIDSLLHSCNLRDELDCDSPSQFCNTGTEIEVIQGDLSYPAVAEIYYSPYSRTKCPPSGLVEHGLNYNLCHIDSDFDSDASGSIKCYKNKSIPDLVVSSRENPGFFPLLVDIRPAGRMPSGVFKNVKQMLSKIFFQDVIFSMIVSPLSYRILIMYKRVDTIYFESTEEIKFTTKKITSNNEPEISLDLDKFTEMCTILYRILKWSLRTSCRLPVN